MPSKIRWLAVATIIVTAVATFAVGGEFFTIPLILGVITEKWTPRRGRWLMWVGAAYLTVTALQMEVVIFPEIIAESRAYHHIAGLGPIFIASILLITCCDVMLLIDAMKRRERAIQRTGLPSVADLIVWISALLFSVYAFWSMPFLVQAYRHGFDRHDILITGWALILIAVWFDIALVSDAITTWRKPAQN